MAHSGNSDHNMKKTLALAIAAVGVVFGDIGTSILYTFQECFHGAHALPVDETHILGITSLILWSLILVVTLKYLWILMNAENKGEGGILTLLSLVPLPLRFSRNGTLALASLMAVAGAALLYGDGIITPAISVLSAMEGIVLIDPAYEKFVMPGAVVIIGFIFFIQSRGTGKIGKYFGAIVVIWFAVAAIMGLKHVIPNPSVLRAFDPRHAWHFFEAEGIAGIRVLSSVVLAITGAEALYADMGHFGKKPIRIAWHWVVMPALMLNYLGQAALLLANPAAAERPFYSMIEQGPLYYGLVLLATMATIIASQALITGAFSITHQAIRLGIFPRVKIVHTSEEMEGRVYIPFINWTLAIACLATVFVFQKSTNLAAAYGLAASGTMLFTTVVFFFVCTYRWKWPLWRSVPLVVVLLAIDAAFFGANLIKIPDGGYFPFFIGVFVFGSMVIWQRGRAQLSRFYKERSKTMEQFFEELGQRHTRRIKGTLVVLASNENKVPPVLARLVDTMHVIHEHVLLVTVVTDDEPYVAQNEREIVTDLSHNVSRVILKFGFMESPDIPTALSRTMFTHLPDFPKDDALYLLGKETFIVDDDSFFGRMRQMIFSSMSKNSSSASDYFCLPSNQVLELGAQLSV